MFYQPFFSSFVIATPPLPNRGVLMCWYNLNFLSNTSSYSPFPSSWPSSSPVVPLAAFAPHPLPFRCPRPFLYADIRNGNRGPAPFYFFLVSLLFCSYCLLCCAALLSCVYFLVFLLLPCSSFPSVLFLASASPTFASVSPLLSCFCLSFFRLPCLTSIFLSGKSWMSCLQRNNPLYTPFWVFVYYVLPKGMTYMAIWTSQGTWVRTINPSLPCRVMY